MRRLRRLFSIFRRRVADEPSWPRCWCGSHAVSWRPGSWHVADAGIRGVPPMPRRWLIEAWVLACLLSVGSGCGIYGGWRGSLLRGDWSLEIDRNCRRAASLGMREQPPAGGRAPAGPVDGCCETAPGCCSIFRLAPPDEPAGGRSVAACHARGEFSSHPAERGQGVAFAHGRFHPVPTRPVFTPWICPQPAPAIGGVKPEPSVPRIAPMPEPRLEIVPTPPESN